MVLVATKSLPLDRVFRTQVVNASYAISANGYSGLYDGSAHGIIAVSYTHLVTV